MAGRIRLAWLDATTQRAACMHHVTDTAGSKAVQAAGLVAEDVCGPRFWLWGQLVDKITRKPRTRAVLLLAFKPVTGG